MADVHNENIEMNAIIAGMNNIPVIHAIDSEEDGSEDDSSDDEVAGLINNTDLTVYRRTS